MLKEFEKELKLLLDKNSIKIKVDSYLGEFENINEIEKCLKSVPRIMINFKSERFINLSQKECEYEIFFINATQNKDEKYRDECKFTLFDLIEEIDELLYNTTMNHGNRVDLLGLKKVYEGVSNYGYISIYAREIKTTLNEDFNLLQE